MDSKNYNLNQPNFGMALNVNSKSIKRSFGPKVAQKVEETVPEIKKMAEDVDVFIKADNLFLGNRNNIIRITVQQKGISVLDKIKSSLNLRPPYKTEGHIFPDLMKKGTLEEKVKNTKDELLLYV